MNDLRTAAQQALEALRAYGAHAHNCDFLILLTSNPPQRKPCSCGLVSAIKSIEAALDEPEPVAWEQFHEHLLEPFYASPQQQAEPVNVEGPADSAPNPAPGLEFDERGVLVPKQAEPEPVAKVELMITGGNAGLATRIVEIYDHLRERLRPGQLLYTAPPTRQPLTPAQEHADELLEVLRRCLNHVENPRLFSCVRNVILKVEGRDIGAPPGCQGPGTDHAHIWVQPWKDSTEMRCARCGVQVKVEDQQ